jgi:o-succinylbenzoate---CoA ligase
MPDLVALALPGGPAFVDAMRRIWDRGDAMAPVDPRLPAPARAALLEALAPARLVDDAGEHDVAGGRPVEVGDALVVATSGTTGIPRGVVLTHDAVVASASATSARLGVSGGDMWLACLPLSHVGGLSVVTRAILTGTRLTVLPGFDATAVEREARAGATLVSLVPTALLRIDASLFRVIVLGGSRPPPERPSNTVTTYGLTESGSGVVYDGRPLDGVEVRFTAEDEILLRAPMLLRCYRDGTDPKDADGWLPTGDVGGWAEDGRLRVHGRRGDLIVTGGENVWPDPVEARLGAHPAVAEVVVAGRDDDEWGQRVVAFVVPRASVGSPSLDDLREWVKAELPAWCAPRELVLRGEIPRTALGKPRRDALLAEDATETPQASGARSSRQARQIRA